MNEDKEREELIDTIRQAKSYSLILVSNDGSSFLSTIISKRPGDSASSEDRIMALLIELEMKKLCFKVMQK